MRYLLALARVLILILIQNLVNIIGNIFIFIVYTKIKYIYFLYVQTQNIFNIYLFMGRYLFYGFGGSKNKYVVFTVRSQ